MLGITVHLSNGTSQQHSVRKHLQSNVPLLRNV